MTRWRSAGGRPASQAEIEEALERDEIARNQLPIIRQAATNWRNGVGLGGILVLVLSAMVGPETILALEDQEKFNAGWLLGIGSLLTFASLGLAMYASFGWPTRTIIGTTGSLRSWQNTEARRAVCCLNISMILAVLALLVLGVGVAVMVFGVPWFWDFPGWG